MRIARRVDPWGRPFYTAEPEPGDHVQPGDVIRIEAGSTAVTVFVNGVEVAQAREDEIRDGRDP